jgi:hypothetical protein
MADQPAPAPAAGAKPKKKGVPTWYYIAGAGALLVAYYAYARSQSSKAAAAAASSTPAAGTASNVGTGAGSYGNAGDLAALAPYLTPTSSGSGVSSSLPNQSATGTVTDASGNTYLPLGSTSYSQLTASGEANNVYYQPQPGIFLPVTYQVASQGLATGLPLFLLTGNQSGPGATPTPQGSVA